MFTKDMSYVVMTLVKCFGVCLVSLGLLLSGHDRSMALAADCPSPPTIEHATIESQDASTVKYRCNGGYEVIGVTTATCDTKSGTWVFTDGRTLVCRRVNCGTPKDIEHASYKERNFQMGDTVSYICNTGYTQTDGVRGHNSITCQPNGQWTVLARFKCGPVTCPSLSNPANGAVKILVGTTGKYDYDHIYLYTCDRGFMTKGRQTLEVTCTATGKWSEENVVCEEANCAEPKTPENGYIESDGNNKYGGVRDFRCFDNATMDGVPSGVVQSLCLNDGSWSDPVPTCTLKPVVCSGEPTIPANSVSWKVDDKKYEVRCKDGFKFEGKDYTSTIFVTCVRPLPGKWTTVTDKCVEVTCGSKPNLPANGKVLKEINKKTYLVGCMDGFRLEGSYPDGYITVTCQNDGKWSDISTAVCSEAKCSDKPVPPENAILKPHETLKDQYVIVCNKDYEIVGGEIVKCDKFTKRWTNTGTICEAKCSDKPVPPKNAILKRHETLKDQYVIVCNKDYEIVGGDIVKCDKSTKRWTNTTTICRKKKTSGGLSTGAIIGIVVGCAVAALIIGIIIYFVIRRGKRVKSHEEKDKERHKHDELHVMNEKGTEIPT